METVISKLLSICDVIVVQESSCGDEMFTFYGRGHFPRPRTPKLCVRDKNLKLGLMYSMDNYMEGYRPWKATLEGLHCLPM